MARSWIAAGDGKTLLTLINDGSGGSSFLRGELCQTLLRSCGYAAHLRGESPILRPGRYSDAQEQGERIFRFRMNAGAKEDRLSRVSREAAVFAIPPYTLSCFPGGEGKTAKEPLVRLESGSVLMTRLDRDPGCPGCFRVRLHESAGQGEKAVLFLPEGKGVYSAFLEPFEIRTLSLDPRTGSVKVIPPTEIQKLNE